MTVKYRVAVPLLAVACALSMSAILQQVSAEDVRVAKPVPQMDHAAVAKRALEAHIRPLVGDALVQFKQLQTATKACSGDPDYRYSALMPAFRSAVLAWGRMAHLNFGPLVENNRYERIFFWLDRKAIGRRQVARALRNAPAAYLDAEQLGDRSIAVQGLPALEQLIVTRQTPQGNADFKCGYAQAIAANLTDIMDRVASAWSEGGVWAKTWLTAGPANPRYISPEETTHALIRAFFEHVERVRDVELLRPIGFAVRGRKLPGPFARSDLTMAFLAARAEGLRALIEQTGLAEEAFKTAVARQSKEGRQAIAQVRFEMRFIAKLTAKFAQQPQFFESAQSSEAIALGFPLKSARQLAERGFVLTADIPAGFNATDGD